MPEPSTISDHVTARAQRGLEAPIDRNAQPIDGGGGGPQDPTMEQRVATLEGDVKDIKASLGRLEATVTRLEASNARIEAAVVKNGDALVKTREDVAELKGRISQLPGSIQIVSIILAASVATALGAGTLALPRIAAAEPMPGVYLIRCQDPATRQWRVLADRIADPETTERPAGEGGGRIVRGKGPDGKPLTVIMPADRTCMMSAR